MTERRAHLAGFRALTDLCALMRRQRLAHPTAGLWEAADLQWWWRHDQRPDPARHVIWYDDAGPVAAVFVSTAPSLTGLDVVVLAPDLVPEARSVAEAMLDGLTERVETSFAGDDPDWIEWGTRLGFAPVDERFVTTWMNADDRPAVRPAANGYRLRSRADGGQHVHHMARRSGAHVADRLEETPLYRPDLDLYVEGPDGDAAGYGLFWADPVTGVGLVEPMRTEDAHQGHGVAGHVLTSGIERLAAAGCTRMKVTYLASNTAAERLYLGVGFAPTTATTTFVRDAP
jgi:GNAT superfamily N-acetyltransferase